MQQPAKPQGLAGLGLTYGEGAMIERIAHFLQFMKTESAPVPADRQELNALLVKYVKVDRLEQMQAVSALRVKRGQEPLPERLTRRFF
jgi:hypothetical protein